MVRKLVCAVSMFACVSLALGADVNSNWTGLGHEPVWSSFDNWSTYSVPCNEGETEYIVGIDGSQMPAQIDLDFHVGVKQINVSGEAELQGRGINWLYFNDLNIAQNSCFCLEEVYLSGDIANQGELELGNLEHVGNVNNAGYLEIWEAYVEGDVSIAQTGVFMPQNAAEIEGAFTNDGLMVMAPQTSLEIDEGSFTNNGLIKFKGGTFAIEESLIQPVNNGTIAGSGIIFSDGDFNNQGRIIADGPGLVVHTEGVFTNNYPSGYPELVVDSGSMLMLEIGASEDPGFDNFGVIKLSPGATLKVNCDPIMSADPSRAKLNNAGSIFMEDGVISASTLDIEDGGSVEGYGVVDCDLNLGSNCDLRFTGDTVINGTLVVEPDGVVVIEDATVRVDGIFNEGEIRVIGGRILSKNGVTGSGVITYSDSNSSSVFDSNTDGKVNLLDMADFAESWLWEASWNTGGGAM